MNRIFLLCPAILMLGALCASAQLSSPSLEQIRIAAEAGDPVAQTRFAEAFDQRLDTAKADFWLRKAAEQGYVHAQARLGRRLLSRLGAKFSATPAERATSSEEPVKWIILAANQGDKDAQDDFANLCLDGKLIKKDLVEAYKWGDLAAKSSPYEVVGPSIRDAAMLQMNMDQIAEARRRVAVFVPHRTQKSEMPEPAWFSEIKLKGISGKPDHRLALINNRTLQPGEKVSLKIGTRTFEIHCVEVRESSAIISIEGVEGTRELKLP